jgi:hypothetical protein
MPCSPLKVNRCSEEHVSRSSLGFFFDPEMEARCSSETSVDFQRTTRRYISEDRTFNNYHCENLKSYKKLRGLHRPPGITRIVITRTLKWALRMTTVDGREVHMELGWGGGDIFSQRPHGRPRTRTDNNIIPLKPSG